jgi:hypothetical protein
MTTRLARRSGLVACIWPHSLSVLKTLTQELRSDDVHLGWPLVDGDHG